MRESDSILPVARQLAAKDLARILKPTSAELIMRDMAVAIEKTSLSPAYTKMVEDLAEASRAVAAFQDSSMFKAFALNTEQMRHVFADFESTFAPAAAAAQLSIFDFGARIAKEFRFDHFKVNEIWLSDITAQIAKVTHLNFAIPEIALTNWPSEALSHRASLVQDCILNTAALETFHAGIATENIKFPERLEAATQFVRRHTDVVCTLPPRLPLPQDNLERQEHRSEEIGAKLELSLRELDHRFVPLRRRAWDSLNGGVEGARLAMAGIRELFEEVFRIVAPESEVKNTTMWLNREDHTIKNPTRKMRLVYVLGEANAAEADAVLQFEQSIKRTNKFVHTFAEDAELVRVHMCHMETWIYLLLHYGMKQGME